MRIEKLLCLIVLLISTGRINADNLSVGNTNACKGETIQIDMLLNNSQNKYVAFQFDLSLPSGISIANDETGQLLGILNNSRKEDHLLNIVDLGAGVYRFLSYSLTNSNYIGSEGPLLSLTLKIDGNIDNGNKIGRISSAIFTDAEGDIYEWGNISFTISISDALIPEIKADNKNKCYGDENPELTYTASSAFSGNPQLTTNATKLSPVGDYVIAVGKGTIVGSYTSINGILKITKAPLKITAGNFTKKLGETNPVFDVTYEGFKNNETDAVLTTKPIISCSATESSPVGTYDIVVSGASATNYEISYVAGTLIVEAVTPSQPDTPSSSEPESQGTTFDEDVNESSTKEVQVTFVVKGSDGSEKPKVAISDDKDVSGNITIPEVITHNGVEYEVTEIGASAFKNNTGLTEITIPASVISIGSNAFAGCKNLKSITTYNKTPIDLSTINARGFTRATGDNVFEGVNKETCILYVPEGSVDQYKAAPVWKEFKHILPIKTSTGIHGVEQTDGEPYDVYNLSGRKVKSKATSLDGLPRGIYIVKGKKVMK